MSRLSLLPLLCIGLAVASVRAEQAPDGVAALVNGDVITIRDVRAVTEPKEKQARATLQGAELVAKIEEIRLATIRDLIDRALIVQEFKLKGYSVPDTMIDDQINAIITNEFHGDRDAFLAALAAQGYTLEEFRELQRNMIIVQTMRSEALRGVPSGAPRKQLEQQWLETLRDKASIKVY